jgi:hypothetical protein
VSGYDSQIVDSNGLVATVYTDRHTLRSEANARLIAAAPALLAFVEEYASLSLGTDVISEKARALVRAAKGAK